MVNDVQIVVIARQCAICGPRQLIIVYREEIATSYGLNEAARTDSNYVRLRANCFALRYANR